MPASVQGQHRRRMGADRNESVCESEIWNPEKGRADGRSANAVTVNRAIDSLTAEINEHYEDIRHSLGFVTAELVKNAMKGIGRKPSTLPAFSVSITKSFISVWALTARKSHTKVISIHTVICLHL